jgi:hypothetical protein
MNSYWGRVQHFFDMVDLRNVLLTDDDVNKASKLLDDFKHNKTPANTTDAQLWQAKKSE